MDFPKQWKGRMAELECIAVPRTQQQVQRQEETNQNQNIYKSASPSKHLGTERVVWVCLWDAVWPSEKTSDHVPFLKLLLYEDSSPNYSFSYCFFVVSCFLSIVIFFSKLKKQTEVAYFFLPFSFALNVNDERLFCMLITSASSCQGYLPVASLSYFNLGFPRSCKFPAYERFR